MVQPELVEFVRRGLFGIKPNGSPGGLTELGPVGLEHQRNRYPEDLGVAAFNLVNQVDPRRNVPPLVGPPDLELDVVVAVEVQEVDRL